MKTGCLCLMAFLIVYVAADAQVVKRKGVEPVVINKKDKKQQALYSLEQLQGKWQEAKRMETGGKTGLAFTDSLQLVFNGKKVEVKDATSMKMGLKGEAQIESPNTLLVAADVFSILHLDKEKLILDDGEFVHELIKKEQFYSETVGKIIIEREIIIEPVDVDLKLLTGKWLVYRRQAEAGIRNEEQALIKSLDIKEILSDSKASGDIVFFTNDITITMPCTFIFSAGNMTIDTEKYTWTFYTYKADGNEFVFGEQGKFLYYTKH